MTVGLGFGVFTLAIYVLAVARVTRLINYDSILDTPRIAFATVFGADSKVVEFIACPWCVGMWCSLLTAIVPVLIVGLPWWWFLLIALATSHLVGVADGLASHEDLSIENVAVEVD
jgi:hypothetical protein